MRGRIIGYGKRTRYVVEYGGTRGSEEVPKEEFDRIFPSRPIGSGQGLIGWKPIESIALEVHTSQVDEMMDHAKKHGVPTEFNRETGAPIFTSRSHRRAYLKMEGVHDRQGGYGDG